LIKHQICLTFLVSAYPSFPGKAAVKPVIYLVKRPKVKTSAKMSVCGTSANSQKSAFAPFTGSFIHGSLSQPMPDCNRLSLHFAYITDILSAELRRSRTLYRQQDSETDH